MNKKNNKRVFISYRQNSSYKKKVENLYNELRQFGINCIIDFKEHMPEKGWPYWMENEIKIADYIILVISPDYRIDNNEAMGITWEINIIYNILYHEKINNSKFIPIIFSDNDKKFIPIPLKGFTYFNISKKVDFERLCAVVGEKLRIKSKEDKIENYDGIENSDYVNKSNSIINNQGILVKDQGIINAEKIIQIDNAKNIKI